MRKGIITRVGWFTGRARTFRLDAMWPSLTLSLSAAGPSNFFALQTLLPSLPWDGLPPRSSKKLEMGGHPTRIGPRPELPACRRGIAVGYVLREFHTEGSVSYPKSGKEAMPRHRRLEGETYPTPNV